MAKALLKQKKEELRRNDFVIFESRNVTKQRFAKVAFHETVKIIKVIQMIAGFMLDLFFSGRVVLRTEPGKFEEVSRHDYRTF